MVFFTCNACGQSIKKNRVEKHWQIECPRCEILSCMDCGKDFYGDEYNTHTSCITEAEKYQGALFKGEKGGQSKGERKQQEWVEKLRQSMASGNYSPRITRLLEMIAEYPNIPRKKSKFENFIKNSINVRDQSTMTTLWDIFNSEVSTQQPAVVEDSKAEDSRVKQQLSVAEQPTSVAENGHDKKKKRKKCDKEQGSSDLVECEATNGVPVVEAEPGHDKKKKRKRHDKEQGVVEHDTKIECEPSSATTDELRKTKKHKRKRRECDDSAAQISEDLDSHLTASLSNGRDDVHTCKRAHLDSGRKHKHKRKSICAA